jgi:hypothetical protein
MAVEIPELFCWTKVGAESGEGLAAIMCRKELERQVGKGTFYWAVGNAVGPALAELAADGRDPAVVFSQMRAAAPAAHPRAPEPLLLWRACHDRFGQTHELPEHAVVTSRAHASPGAVQRPHYALICHSAVPLTAEPSGTLRFNELTNYVTGRPLTYSHVTTLVKRRTAGAARGGPEYPVLMVAALKPPYFVELLDPILLPTEVGMSLGQRARELDAQGWTAFAKTLRNPR